MIENIRTTLYPQIHVKNEFFMKLAKHLGKKPNTLKTHWFSGVWSIPDEHQAQVVDFMQNYIKSQA